MLHFFRHFNNFCDCPLFSFLYYYNKLNKSCIYCI